MKMNCGHSADLTLAKGPRRDLIRLNGVHDGTRWSRTISLNGACHLLEVLHGVSEKEFTEATRETDQLCLLHSLDPIHAYMLYDTYDWQPDGLLAIVRPHEAFALREGLKRLLADAIVDEPERELWLLSSTCVEVNASGADAVISREELYPTREKACDRLREFMRSDVNEANDGEWEDGYTVDDALDSIFEYDEDLESDGDGKWTYDGVKLSCEWRLLRKRVRA